jgi:hypothetical protein
LRLKLNRLFFWGANPAIGSIAKLIIHHTHTHCRLRYCENTNDTCTITKLKNYSNDSASDSFYNFPLPRRHRHLKTSCLFIIEGPIFLSNQHILKVFFAHSSYLIQPFARPMHKVDFHCNLIIILCVKSQTGRSRMSHHQNYILAFQFTLLFVRLANCR